MQPDLTVLAIDTSAAHCAVALISGHRCLAHRLEPMAKGQAERLFPLIQELLSKTGKTFGDLSGIGVCTGPGNFTGVRIAVSAARGLALSTGKPALGITHLELAAFQHLRTNQPTRPFYIACQLPRQSFGLQKFDGTASVSPLGKARLAEAAERDQLAAQQAPVLGVEPVLDETGIVDLAFLTATRLPDANPAQRPAPLYLRAANAAVSSDPPVVILS